MQSDKHSYYLPRVIHSKDVGIASAESMGCHDRMLWWQTDICSYCFKLSQEILYTFTNKYNINKKSIRTYLVSPLFKCAYTTRDLKNFNRCKASLWSCWCHYKMGILYSTATGSYNNAILKSLALAANLKNTEWEFCSSSSTQDFISLFCLSYSWQRRRENFKQFACSVTVSLQAHWWHHRVTVVKATSVAL